MAVQTLHASLSVSLVAESDGLFRRGQSLGAAEVDTASNSSDDQQCDE
jgi:hypothetical protein